MKSNIVLIGMPGCGKSTCGVLVAKSLCKSFIDTDLLIQTEEGMKLQDLIDSKGRDYFAETEERIVAGIKEQDCIISTGGSVVYYEEAMKQLRKNGIIVYLKISCDVMIQRIKNITTRGILLKEGETMEDMFRFRETLYESYADRVIDCDRLTIEQTVEKICKKKSGIENG